VSLKISEAYARGRRFWKVNFYFTDGEEQDRLLDLHSIRGRVLIWHVAIKAQNQYPYARIR
jgi:hypothetical protein